MLALEEFDWLDRRKTRFENVVEYMHVYGV
jgi:hypothetical protein